MPEDEVKKYRGLIVEYNEGKDFVFQIQKLAPSFDLLDYRYVLRIAYPIAIMEVEAWERTKEDFPLVEKTILKMYRNQISEPGVISRAIGLSESYVSKVARLLESYGHIKDDRITELGVASLNEDASIKVNQNKRRIQVDAVTGAPIGIRELVSEQVLQDLYESRTRPHLEPLEQLDRDKLEALVKEQYTNYVDKGDYSLHTNVESISNVQLVEIKYAKAYYLADFVGNVFFMCESYDSAAKKLKERFRWRALYASNPSKLAELGITGGDLTNSSFSTPAFSAFKSRVEKERQPDLEEIETILDSLYSFDWQQTELVKENRYVLKVTTESFVQYDRFVLKCLESIADDGYDFIMLDRLKGEIVLVKTEDETLLDLVRQFKKAISSRGRNNVISFMTKLSMKEGSDVISIIRKLIHSSYNKTERDDSDQDELE